MAKYNKNMTLGEVISEDERTKGILMGFGMHCFSCPMSQMETLEEASMVHGIDTDLLVKKLNELEESAENCKNDKCCKKKVK